MALPDYITTAREEASSAAGLAGGLAAQEYSIGDILKKKVQEAFDYSKDVIGPLDTATMNYVSAPSRARMKFADVWNPTQKEALVSQYTGNEALPMLSLGSVLGQRFGRAEDLIGAGTRGFQAMAAAKQAEAESKRNAYADMLNEYQLQKNIELQEAQANQPLGYEYISAGDTTYVYDPNTNSIVKSIPHTGTGGGGLGSLASLFGLDLSGGGTTRPSIEGAIEGDDEPATTGWVDPLLEVQRQEGMRKAAGGVDFSKYFNPYGNVVGY